MSDTRKAHEQLAATSTTAVKWIKVTGWIFIGIGVLLCLSVIGIPAGLFFIAIGFVFIKFLASFMAKTYKAGFAAQAEAVEIHEHQLRQAREARERGDQAS